MVENIALTKFNCVFLFIHFLQVVNSDEPKGDVVLANVLFRHGQRTPEHPYANDPYKNVSMWPVGFGQLTNFGKNQEFELGQWLRKKYNSLLTDTYSSDIIHVLSSDFDRTLMSAECLVAGLYPPTGNQTWNPDLDWQPIPVHTVPKYSDNMIVAVKPCPAYDEEFQKLLRTKAFQDLNSSFIDVYEVLNKNSGEHITTIKQIDQLYSCLSIEKSFNFTLPEWTKPVFPERMFQAAIYNKVLPTNNTLLARLKSGALVKDMIQNLKRKKANDPKSKSIYIYSGHDATLANLMNGMKVFNMEFPQFAACFMMELRMDSEGEYTVTISYRDVSGGDSISLILPNCTLACPLDKFIKLLEPITVDDWDAECDPKFFSYASLLIIVQVLVVMLVLLLFAMVLLAFWVKKRSHAPSNIVNQRQPTDALMRQLTFRIKNRAVI